MDEKEKVEEAAPKAEAQPTGVPTAGTISGVNGPMPAELHGWNWGAFCLTWIWGIANSSYLAFLCFIPFVNVIMVFILGAKGNEWAWTHRKFESVAQFKAVQKAWTTWGLVILGINILLIILSWGAIIALVASGKADSSTVNNMPIVY